MSRVQTVVDPKLKSQAEQKFNDLGLNLSEGVRFILTNFVNGNINISFNQDTDVVTLSPEAKAKYKKIMQDIEKEDNILDLESLE